MLQRAMGIKPFLRDCSTEHDSQIDGAGHHRHHNIQVNYWKYVIRIIDIVPLLFPN